MSDFQLSTPIAFMVFNRPDTTKRVFEAIRQAKPPQLLVVADGPRPGKPDDIEKCAAVRTIIEQVDWDCEVLTNFAESNLGCKHRVSSGLDWVFEIAEEAIILEDDCLPNSTFFQFCDELLHRYRYDERVMMISGTNHLSYWKSDMQSYHFSYYGGIWGWATWRRSWDYYDANIKLWTRSEVKDRIRDILLRKEHYQRYVKIFDDINLIDTWDYQWLFARLVQSGLSVVPSVNLISNIGFGQEATHTKSPLVGISNLALNSMVFPLQLPYGMMLDKAYDHKYFNIMGYERKIIIRAVKKIMNLLDWIKC
jgi:hypothetical protein